MQDLDRLDQAEIELKQARRDLSRIEEDHEERAAKYDQPFKFVASDGTKFRTKEGLKAFEASLTVKKTGATSGRIKKS